MITLRLTVVDFMDARPIPTATLQVLLIIYYSLPQGSSVALAGDFEPPPGEAEPIRRFRSKQIVHTDDDGNAVVNFDTIALLQDATKLPTDDLLILPIRAQAETDISFAGVAYPRQLIAADLESNETHECTLIVDLGMSIVGHTTTTSSRLWFHLPVMPAENQQFICRVRTDLEVAQLQPSTFPIGGTDIGRRWPVVFDTATRTAVVDVDRLAPGSTHRYELITRIGRLREYSFVMGTFRTPSLASARLRFAFGSCHLPAVDNTINPSDVDALRTLERWQRLADARDYEFLLLIGDQIYGDGIEDKWPNLPPLQQYMQRYQQLWVYHPMRTVLRSTPTYMILDDHDIADDYGIANLDDAKVVAGLECYKKFQHSHNPPGANRPIGPFCYHFNWGPAAFFVMDGRTSRRTGLPISPVFGAEQLADLRLWATAPETRAADVIVFVAPVPLALLPSETIRSISEELAEEVGVAVGIGTGALVGGLVGGPFGAVLGAALFGVVGHEVAEEVYESYIDRSLLTNADIGERWDLRENQADLVQLLKLLFDLANGIGDTPPRPRAVIILSGDIHAGTIHGIRALPTSNDYRRNPVIFQLTSSAISHEPVNSTLYAEAVSRIDENVDIGLKDLNLLTILDESEDWDGLSSGAIDVDDVFDAGAAEFLLDPNLDRRFLAQFAGLLMERSIGHVDITLRDLPERKYRFRFKIEGQSNTLKSDFDLVLNASTISPITDDAEILSFKVPNNIRIGQPITAEVVVRNTGAVDWRPDEGIALEIRQELWNIDRVPLREYVTSDSSTTIRFRLNAPSVGQFPISCHMTRERIGSRFGQHSRTQHVTVLPQQGDDLCRELSNAREYAQRVLKRLRDEASAMAEPNLEILRRISGILGQLRGIDKLIVKEGCNRIGSE